ncbi:hypothetical protein EIL81_03735 [Photorhabdus laumondii subsp. laumondii]|nr:hypothetical protein [Photorhabdus laumondii subsp. laumondii]
MEKLKAKSTPCIDIILLCHIYPMDFKCIATARERIPGNMDNYVIGVSKCNQQRGDLKDNGYK